MLAGWPELAAIIWLAVIIDSSIHRIWRLAWLAGWLAGWLASWAGLGWLAGWLAISLILMDFQHFLRFHGFQGSRVRNLRHPVPAVSIEMLPLK